MIYEVGDEFVVDQAELEEGESSRKMFVGSVTIREGVVTHLWLRGSGDICKTGYPVEMLKPAPKT